MDSKETQVQSSLSLDDQACLKAMLLCSSHVLPLVLNAAIELDLFAIMAEAGPGAQISPSEIASRLPIKNSNGPSMLDRMLRLLASYSLLTCSASTSQDGDVERRYGLTPTARFFIRNQNKSDLTSLFRLHCQPATLDVWFHMKDVILEGGSVFEKAHGMSIFKYMDSNESFSNIFHSAMVARSTIIMEKVLEIYKGFEGLKSLVDVGGGTGHCLHMIISKYPSISGTNLDLPHATENAPPYPGIKHVAGDMFASIPNSDAIMIKDVLHNWNDEDCIKLLRNCYEALPHENGKVIIIDLIMPETPDSSMVSKYASELDNIMLTQPGGRERTRREMQALCMKSGFSRFQIACFAFSVWPVMEFYK